MTPRTPERELALRELEAKWCKLANNGDASKKLKQAAVKVLRNCAKELREVLELPAESEQEHALIIAGDTYSWQPIDPAALLNEAPAAPTLAPECFSNAHPGCDKCLPAPASTPAEPLSAERELGWRLENRPRRGLISRDGGKTWGPHEMVDEWWFVDEDGRETLAMYPRLVDLWNAFTRLRQELRGREATTERTAQIAAHRVCCGTEHDPANGKLHGYCVVCGVPWPCEYAGKPGGSHE